MTSPGPVHLLAGGKKESRSPRSGALSRAIAALGKRGPSLAYVGAASGDSNPFRLMIAGFLRAAGAGEVLPVALCRKRPDLAGAMALLDGCDAVFVSGGDVEEGMRVLREKGVCEHLRALHSQGKPFIGVSAGSILLARSWIRWADPDDDASAEVFPCLDIAPLYCDTHEEDAGWPELRALLGLLPDGAEGWGIPSGGGLHVRGEGEVRWTEPAPARFRRGAEGVFAL